MSVEELRSTWHKRRGRLLEVLQSHPALVITGVYLFLTAIGLLYSTLFFRQLGMHFSDYAQLFRRDQRLQREHPGLTRRPDAMTACRLFLKRACFLP